MSSTDRPDEEGGTRSAHDYFRAIEDSFIRLRGAPFLLSPEDWRVAQGWHRAGVPVSLVERVLERIFVRQKPEEGGRRRVRSLRYFDGAVRAAWVSARSLTGAEGEREAEPLAVDERVATLAAAIPRHLSGAGDLAARVRKVSGAAEEVEKQLEDLDGEMLSSALDEMGETRREELEARVDEGLQKLAGRLSGPDFAAARERLRRQAARRLLGLPILSLFSADARRADEESLDREESI